MTPLLEVSGLTNTSHLALPARWGVSSPGRSPQRPETSQRLCALSMVSLLPSHRANALAWSVNLAAVNLRWYG